MRKLSNKYNEDSIQKMNPLEFCRHRPDSYLGSNEDSSQLLREIISNASDEFLIGNCSEIHVEYDEKTNVARVYDTGQGIVPNVIKEDGKSVLELVYGEINSSGKYDKSESAVYQISTGAFGIGAFLTNALSHWLVATTKRDGQFEKVYFEEGEFSKRESGKCDKSEHGVCVEFNPSGEFFRDERPNIKKIKEELFNLSCVCKGLKVTFNGEEFYHPEGLDGIIQEAVKNNIETTSSRFSFESKASDIQIFDFCMTATSNNSCEIIPFCNYSLIETGVPVSTVKSTITRCFNDWAKEEGLIKKNLGGGAIQEGLVIAFNLVSQNIRYDSQTKVRVTSTEDNSFISSALGKQLKLWLDNHPQDAKNILNQAILSAKAAEAAKKAREAVKQKAAGKTKKKFLDMPTTLVDCKNKDRSQCDLIVVEGKSAASSLVAQRNASTVAVYSVRGMMLNLLKCSPDKILQNKEINNLVTALGLDYDTTKHRMIFDKTKLRYGRIIAASDADAAGAEIENLFFNILWKLCPELILNGYVYSAEPPLFRATLKDNSYHFLADQKALSEFQKKHKDIKEIHRAKGLAEQLPEQLAESLLNEETRKMRKLTVSDIEKTNKFFEDLYGKEVRPRVEYINENPWNVQVDYE